MSGIFCPGCGRRIPRERTHYDEIYAALHNQQVTVTLRFCNPCQGWTWPHQFEVWQ